MENQKKEKISEEERLKLAEKLDKDLDEFINSLEKKRYSDGWPEDKWRDVMLTSEIRTKLSYCKYILGN